MSHDAPKSVACTSIPGLLSMLALALVTGCGDPVADRGPTSVDEEAGERVAPGGEGVDDATLAARVRTALDEQNIVDGAAISVSVEDGRVALTGDLRPYQIPLADGLVRRVEGVHEVDNRLRATTGVP